MKKTIIYINKIEGKSLEARAQLALDPDLEFFDLDLTNNTTFFSPQLCPCVLVCMDMKVARDFLKRYKDIIRETSSKFCFMSLKALPPKEENLLLVLGGADVSSDEKLQAKAIVHKLKLYAKSLPDLDEATKNTLKFKHLNIEKKKTLTPEKRSEINFETVDFFVIEKFCAKSLRNIADLEISLENYEQDSTSSNQQIIYNLFEEIRKDAFANDLLVISDFLEIPKHILKRANEVEDNTFKAVLVGILFNLADFLRTEMNGIKNKKHRKQILENPHKGIFERLYWLDDKFRTMLNDDTIKTELEKIGVGR